VPFHRDPDAGKRNLTRRPDGGGFVRAPRNEVCCCVEPGPGFVPMYPCSQPLRAVDHVFDCGLHDTLYVEKACDLPPSEGGGECAFITQARLEELAAEAGFPLPLTGDHCHMNVPPGEEIGAVPPTYLVVMYDGACWRIPFNTVFCQCQIDQIAHRGTYLDPAPVDAVTLIGTSMDPWCNGISACDTDGDGNPDPPLDPEPYPDPAACGCTDELSTGVRAQINVTPCGCDAALAPYDFPDGNLNRTIRLSSEFVWLPGGYLGPPPCGWAGLYFVSYREYAGPGCSNPDAAVQRAVLVEVVGGSGGWTGWARLYRNMGDGTWTGTGQSAFEGSTPDGDCDGGRPDNDNLSCSLLLVGKNGDMILRPLAPALP
jgi:hypothetical protein